MGAQSFAILCGSCSGTRDVLLDMFGVNIDGRVLTGAMPILEDVSVGVDVPTCK